MILREEVVEQVIDRDRRVRVQKWILRTLAHGGGFEAAPIAMVRKRAVDGGGRGVVMLIHGFGQNRYTWHVQGRSFSAYLAEAGWDVYNIDLRGHGRSAHLGARRPRLLDEYIQRDVPACIEWACAESKVERVALVGHSMGGLVSYAVAACDRPRVGAVVSIGTPVRFGRGSVWLEALAKAAHWADRTGLLASNPVFPVRWFGRHFLEARWLWDARLAPIPIRAWQPRSIAPEILHRYLADAFDPTSVSVALDIVRIGQTGQYLSEDGSVDYGQAFRASDTPLLVIAGSGDTLAPPRSVRPAYDVHQAKDKTYRVFPQGHVDLIVGDRAPASVWPTVRDWLAEHAYLLVGTGAQG